MVKRIIAIIVCVISISAAITSGVSYYLSKSEQEDLQRQIADVQNEIDAKEMANEEVRIQVLSDVASLSDKRLNDDAALFDEVFNIAFTWHDYAEYMEMRETLISTYGFAEDGQFLTDVFPVMEASSDDPEYNLIDGESIQIEFGRCVAYCIGHTGLTYHYFGEIYFRSLGASGSSYTLVDGFTVDVDSDGNMKDLFVIDLAT